MSLETEVYNLKIIVKGLQEKIAQLEADVQARSYSSEIVRATKSLKSLIKDNSKLIDDIEQKLSKINLPEETRYYLSEGEVSQFQANFNKLRAMMVNFRKLYDSLVAYTASR